MFNVQYIYGRFVARSRNMRADKYAMPGGNIFLDFKQKKRADVFTITDIYLTLSVENDDPCSKAYLLGLLAMIKCSICSYQCDN